MLVLQIFNYSIPFTGAVCSQPSPGEPHGFSTRFPPIILPQHDDADAVADDDEVEEAVRSTSPVAVTTDSLPETTSEAAETASVSGSVERGSEQLDQAEPLLQVSADELEVAHVLVNLHKLVRDREYANFGLYGAVGILCLVLVTSALGKCCRRCCCSQRQSSSSTPAAASIATADASVGGEAMEMTPLQDPSVSSTTASSNPSHPQHSSRWPQAELSSTATDSMFAFSAPSKLQPSAAARYTAPPTSNMQFAAPMNAVGISPHVYCITDATTQPLGGGTTLPPPAPLPRLLTTFGQTTSQSLYQRAPDLSHLGAAADLQCLSEGSESEDGMWGKVKTK